MPDSFKKIFLVLLLFPLWGISQQSVLDSLQQELASHSAKDSVRVSLLIKTAGEMTYSNPKEAFPLVDEAIAISSETDWIKGESYALRQKGNLHYVMGDDLAALDVYQKAQHLAQSIGDRSLEASLLSNIGNIFADLKQYDRALENYEAYLTSAQTLGNVPDEIKALSNIAIIYNDTKKYEEGVANLEKALKLSKQEENDLFVAAITNNLALAYKKLEDYPKALLYYQEAADLAHQIGNKYIEASALNSIGMVNIILKNYDLAALNGRKALDLSQEIEAVEWQADSWKVLSEVYEHEGEMAEALHAYKEHVRLQDSVLSEEKKSELTRKEMQFKMERQQAKAEEEIKRQHLVKNGYLAGAILLALISIASYFLYKRRRDALEKRKVVEFNAKVAETELKALRSQMNPHFIFNSLNSISDFISRNDIKQADEYLVKFSKLTRAILENSEKKWITLEEDLELMELYMQLEAIRLENHLEYSITVDEDIEPDNTLVPPMILQPFIENSIWHGIAPKGNTGKIDIQIKKKGDMLLCVVEDNGIGRATASMDTKEKSSLGVKITTNRIEIINHIKNTEGSIDLIDKKEGLRVEINLPLELQF
ncbi:tetratricopeptide repeat protein [Flagellimonas amoyensis]|uniref:tetratricopeptide repeat-containing sensor histidine kinase n=1 Tax=Flagellimonas amoyensis TaxID=2169401 RepID=UPI000D378135|nr:tetratricopeptide repeat protein [Allomuricauda amoyensis]